MGMTNYPLGDYALVENLISGALSSDITDTTATQVLAAQNNKSIFITNLLITNSNEDVGTVVKLTDGEDGDILWRGYASALGGFAIEFPAPLVFSYETAIFIVCETTGANIQVSVSGFVK